MSLVLCERKIYPLRVHNLNVIFLETSFSTLPILIGYWGHSGTKILNAMFIKQNYNFNPKSCFKIQN